MVRGAQPSFRSASGSNIADGCGWGEEGRWRGKFIYHLGYSLRAPTFVCGALMACDRRSPQTTRDIATLAGKGKVQPVIYAFACGFHD